ncbi:MAG: pseudouridine synthase, partial [Bauldia litoralis]
MAVTHHTVAGDEAGLRLDRWFKRHFPALGHGRLEKLLRTGQVRVDGGRVKAGQRLEVGQSIRVPPLDPGAAADRPAPKRPSVSAADVADLKSWILWQDDQAIVINKPPGLPVQGGTKSARNLDAMLDALANDKGVRPKLVHRLDKDTSGVLLLARNAAAAAALAGAFRHKTARKLY